LTGLIVHFNDQVLAKILECDLLTQASTLQPDLARPLLEGVIVGDAALEGNGIVLGAPRRFTAAAGIAALAVLHHLGGTLQGTDLADAGNIFAIPLDLELEILIGIEARCINAKLSHEFASLPYT